MPSFVKLLNIKFYRSFICYTFHYWTLHGLILKYAKLGLKTTIPPLCELKYPDPCQLKDNISQWELRVPVILI